ncbi:MAG: hypothetical protein PWP14_1057 [Methanolobus sp.]|jgi:hypothetical protein|nr:hypothetical protein [Methanolobus sp.]MDN5309663.1 hypothetical protein [Methanolobus sp.]
MLTKNKNNFSDIHEIGKFIHETRKIILLYVVGDFLTTFHALESGLGFEENGILAALLAEFGIWSLLVIQLAIMGVIFCAYRTFTSSEDFISPVLWQFSRTGISLFGLALVMNNLMVIWFRISLFEYVGLM